MVSTNLAVAGLQYLYHGANWVGPIGVSTLRTLGKLYPVPSGPLPVSAFSALESTAYQEVTRIDPLTTEAYWAMTSGWRKVDTGMNADNRFVSSVAGAYYRYSG